MHPYLHLIKIILSNKIQQKPTDFQLFLFFELNIFYHVSNEKQG